MSSDNTRSVNDPFSVTGFQFYKGLMPQTDNDPRGHGPYSKDFDNLYGQTYLSVNGSNEKLENSVGMRHNGDISKDNGFITNGYGASSSRTKTNGRKSEDEDDSASVASFDSKGKQKSFARVWIRFAEKTSMQGIPYIYNAKLIWAKVAWVILTLVAFGVMVWHLYYLIDQYYAWPKQTKIELGFSNLKFPDITVCNTNIVKKSKLEQMVGAEDLKSVVNYLNPQNLVGDVQIPDDYPDDNGGGSGGDDTQPAPKARRKRFIDEHRDFNFSKYDFNDPTEKIEYEPDEYDGEEDYGTQILYLISSLYMDLPRHERQMLGHNISDMLVSCTFNGRICDEGQFRLLQTAEYGNCWTISSPQFVARSSGPYAGFQLILYMETAEYLQGITNGFGARLAINEERTYPFPFDEGIDIAAGMETSIGLKLISISRLGQPYGDCDDGISFANKYNTTYSKQACQLICIMEAIMDTCNCFEDSSEQIAMGKNSSYHPCRSERAAVCDDTRRSANAQCVANRQCRPPPAGPCSLPFFVFTERDCMNNITRSFDKKEAECVCYNPCQQCYWRAFVTMILLFVPFLEMLTAGHWEMIHTEKEAKLVELLPLHNFLKLNIYYEDLNFENITEEPEIQPTQFLSDVGGAIGLWIGLSVLAFCEVFQLLVELCDYGIHKVRKKNRRKREKAKERRKRRSKERRLEILNNGGPKFGQWPQTEFNHNQMNNVYTRPTDYMRH